MSFDKHIINNKLGKKAINDILDRTRIALVNAQRIGEMVLIDLDKLAPDFFVEYTNDEIFPAELVFNRTEWIKEENYMRYVLEDENYSIGGINPGNYILQKDFCL